MTETIAQLNQALAGRYLLSSEIGAGGMASVYLAEDLRHRRKAALGRGIPTVLLVPIADCAVFKQFIQPKD